jgi:adenosylmethionine-8-amino-7-oxononanoate aminotransferase
MKNHARGAEEQRGSSNMTSVLYRVPAAPYPKAVMAQGMYIQDDSGKRYLDMSGGAAVSCLGHAHPQVVTAVRDQVGKLAFAHTAFFTHEPQERLAQQLTERFGDPSARAYFTSGGSEANETALKITWQYWAARGKPDKKIIISREHSYHGNTFGVLSVSGNSARRRASAAPLLDWPRIAPCYAHRNRVVDESMEQYVERVSGELESAIMQVGADRVAAFICEPVVGSSLGVVAAEAGYLQRIRAICDRYDILWIADEIMCGSGRTGTFFAFEHDGTRPDIATLAKGIGGGYQPLAATVLSGHIADTLQQSGFTHGHTYIGHPVSCAAGCAVQDVLNQDKLLARTQKCGQRFGQLLAERFCEHPNVSDIRGRGLFWALELVSDRVSKRGFPDGGALPERLMRTAMDTGLICYPGGIEVDGACIPHIMLAPPMIIEESHMLEAADKLATVLAQVLDD